jgi:hypothetical protein
MFVGFDTSLMNLHSAQADMAPTLKFIGLVTWPMNLLYVTSSVGAHNRWIYVAKADVARAV